ncbi:uncharacterized protein At4g15970 isoform X1 [Manihot esculenta]|uniref:Glycosyltransferase n=1 Tax=Manihot esculenta TaxID=3983 RepID=A0A2C9VLH3_MANES|nr:uncharacterized protein At4g15970 isoform X1 [Manihot esculenta]OAY46466.1 hypothetical protein MANES_06G002200v8 [Manihot esculenta]
MNSLGGGDMKSLNVVVCSGEDDNKQPIPSSSSSSASSVEKRLIGRIVAVFLVGVTVSCLVLYKQSFIFRVPLIQGNYGYDYDSDLERVLKAASMGNKTVIITTLNEAWAEEGSIIDLFLESFKIGNNTQKLVKNLVIISLDQKAYTRCLAIHPHCFALKTKGLNFSSEAYFMTPNYLEMMWRRIRVLLTVLQMGYSFVFTDADIMWLRDPFPHFYEEADFQIACDNYYGNPSDRNNRPNGGFNYVKSNERTIKFYKFWYSSREKFPGLHDQDVLNKIKFDPLIDRIGMQMRFLDTAYFGGFCEPSKDFNLVCTMHANCCFGLENKVHDLKLVLQDWRSFMLKPNLSSFSWRAPQKCRISS